MRTQRTAEYRTALIEKRRELEETLSRTAESRREATDARAQDVGDLAETSYEKESTFQYAQDNRSLLADVSDAIMRIDEGSYGRCSNCGREIESKRLDAVPWARYCMKCQEQKDNGLL